MSQLHRKEGKSNGWHHSAPTISRDGDDAVRARSPLRYFRSVSIAQNPARQPMRMNWVVVIGNNGSRLLRMQWLPNEDC